MKSAETTLSITPRAEKLDAIPPYLRTHYWWAYIHPWAVKLFERQWVVNLILLGNHGRLRDAALQEFGESLAGKTLQVACVYGDLTVHLNRRVAALGGKLDVVDVLPIQLWNLKKKLPDNSPARLLGMNSTNLKLPDASYDQALVFFLLHEQPPDIRRHTLEEIIRVVKPGGKIVIVDYANPPWWHPMRYLWRPVFMLLEPFALDLWREEINAWLPTREIARLRKELFFGNYYQKVVIERANEAAPSFGINRTN